MSDNDSCYSSEFENDRASTFDEVCYRASTLPPKDRPAAKDRVLERLARDKGLSASALAVGLTVLMDLMWEHGCADRLGFADLAQRTGRDRSTVKRATAALIRHGHLLVERERISSRSNKINRYTFYHFFS